jgi:flagellar motor switch protein FliN
MATNETEAPQGDARSWDRILDIPLEMTVRLGERRMRIRDLLRLEPNAILELNRSVDDPVELVVSGQVVARGEVLVEQDRLAIRVLDVVATAERLRSLA